MIKEKYQDTNATFKYRTVKPEEIVASGGTDAWAEKVGASFKNFLEGLETLPKTDMTDEELNSALQNLEQTK
jgi:hypothetical protein